MLRDCAVLLFDEPTRGIDVRAKQAIYRQLHDLAADGKAIVVVSSELQELLAICDRIAVLSAGRLVETFDRGDWTAGPDPGGGVQRARQVAPGVAPSSAR